MFIYRVVGIKIIFSSLHGRSKMRGKLKSSNYRDLNEMKIK